VAGISPEVWGAMGLHLWDMCCGQSAELPAEGTAEGREKDCVASGSINRSLTASFKGALKRQECLSTADGDTNLLTRPVLSGAMTGEDTMPTK